MNKFKRLQLFLCSLLVCCAGFLSTDSLTVHAFTSEDNFYPILIKNAQLVIQNGGTELFNSGANENPESDNKYHFNNPKIDNITQINFYKQYPNTDQFTFPYNPTIYEYYILGTVVAECTDYTQSTFKPTNIEVYYYNPALNKSSRHTLSDVNIYDIDNSYEKGYGVSFKVDFEGANNTGISVIAMLDDKDGFGSKPANLVVEFGILAVEKSSSQLDIQAAILNQLKQMETSITENIQNGSNAIQSAVGQSAEKITGAIEDQYEMSEDEDFGVDEIKGDVEEKLGVLNFTADTLSSFLDLFNADTVGDATITFPAFSIEVQGESYTVWNNIEFDLSFLEENFWILVTAVRTVTVLCVWLALLSYLGKAKDQIIVNRG